MPYLWGMGIQMVDLNTHELAWAAGLFDGEGHTGHGYGKGTNYSRRLNLRITQKNTEVLYRFWKAVGGIGTVSGPYTCTHDCYFYAVQDFQSVQAIIAMLWKWMSPIKKQQAKAALILFSLPTGLPDRRRRENKHLPPRV